MFTRYVSIIALASLSACTVDAGSQPEPLAEQLEPLGRGQYVEARYYFSTSEDRDAWYNLTRQLRTDFDNICGDTFCEGDYSNYESLGFRCSVEERRGTIGRCVWTFAASVEDVTPSTGNIKVQAEIFRCKLPSASGIPVADFVKALSVPGQEALFAPLPGTTLSLYDGLTGCL